MLKQNLIYFNTYLRTALFIIPIFIGCTNNPVANDPTKGVMVNKVGLNKPQLDFIAAFAKSYTDNGQVYMLSSFRNRYFKPVDQKEAEKFFEKRKEKNYIKELTINNEKEIILNEPPVLANIKWINEDEINSCKETGNTFWNCLNKQYPTESFFYLSIPIISADGKYALVHVNYMNLENKKSYGGGRIFAKQNNQWEEIALLTNWGKLPN